MTGADAPTTSGSAAPTEAAASGAKMTFKGAARLVLAAKRFQAALNPTYTFGKRADSGDNAAATASGWVRTDGASSGGGPPSRTSSPVEIAATKAAASAVSGGGASTPPKVVGTPPLLGTTPPKKVYDHHGHKGNLLMNPLPDVVVLAPAAAEKA